MPFLSLRTRILLVSSALLIALTAATLAYVSLQANGYVNQRLVADLRRSQDLIVGAQRDRVSRLQLAAQAVASFPELRAVIGTDALTQRDTLIQQASGLSDLAILFDPAGRVIARTDTPTLSPIPDVHARWLEPALVNRVASGVLVTEAGIYYAAVAPAEAGGMVFAFVMAGDRIDRDFALSLRDVSRTEIALLGETRILGATLAQHQVPWQTQREWRAASGGGPGPHAVTIAGEAYAAMTAPTPTGGTASSGPQAPVPGGLSAASGAESPALPSQARASGAPMTIVSLQSRDQAIAPYRRIQMGLILLGVVAAAVGIGGSALLARNITAPVATLAEGTRQVAAGNFDFQLDVRRQDELGQLAASFNRMTQGLRERADMQKFVSQSTVEMIQARTKPASAGERRVLTMFFSDVRGFTALSEHRSPEDVVRVLNRLLSLQADLVRKFEGDVDKFIGDAVFAWFIGDDMVLHAIRCAVEIHRAIDALNASAPDDPPLALGIGIVTGEAILGSIGSADRLDYTAIGSNVNLSSRLCGLAGPREILLNESAYQQVRDLVAAEPMEPLEVKGLSDPVRAYRMIVRPAV